MISCRWFALKLRKANENNGLSERFVVGVYDCFRYIYMPINARRATIERYDENIYPVDIKIIYIDEIKKTDSY